MVLDARGKPLTERARVETPSPATPAAIVDAIAALVAPFGAYERISVGFPGVVVLGVTRSAPNLGDGWKGFDLRGAIAKRLGKPTRAMNDAGVQGHGIVSGKGTEIVLTLGTGMGCALFADGKYMPNLELAHHPLRGKKTYEDYIGNAAREKVGDKKWNTRVGRVLAVVDPIFNPRRIYLGGGNAKKLTLKLPDNVTVADNLAGLLGGIALWRDRP